MKKSIFFFFEPSSHSNHCFFIDERTNPPTITWEDPRPAYYMAQERGQYAPPPPGMQSSPSAHQRGSPQPQQQQQQVQTVHTIQNADGSITTLSSSGNQPIIIQSPSPQQQQPQVQQAQSKGPSLGRTIVGAAVVSSVLRPRPRVIVAPRRRRF